jgi:predicted secreted hydrolase
MNENTIIKNKKIQTFSRIKTMVSCVIILMMIIPIIPAQAQINKDQYYHPEPSWKQYPYQPPGTQIMFPTDEGSHETSEYPIEWWYANFHLIGQKTGHEYGAFLAFYKIQSSIAEKKEVRIFSISDISNEKTYTNVQIGTLTASSDHLDLSFKYITNEDAVKNQTVSNPEIENIFSQSQETSTKTINQTNPINTPYNDTILKTSLINDSQIESQESPDGFIQYDHWFTKNNDQGLLPFQYHLEISGNSQQDSQSMSLEVDMDCIKKPLMVGGDGYISYENDKKTFYYSLTRIIATGTIIIHGFPEEILGYAWVDHQWGNFFNQNPPPFGLPMTYEWFSLQLNNQCEILVGDMWDRETGEKIDQSLTSGLNLIDSDGNSELLYDYMITPLRFWNDTTNTHFYSCQWHITEVSNSIDIVVTPLYSDQMMRFKENSPILQQLLEALFPSACFWEGVCSISGTINGNIVNGKSYVELTHYYNGVRK